MINPQQPHINRNEIIEKEPEQQGMSKRSISERWLDLIYDNLERITKNLQIAHNGSIDLDTYVQMQIKEPNATMLCQSYRIKAIDLTLGNFTLLLENFGNSVLKQEFKKDFLIRLTKIKTLWNKPDTQEDYNLDFYKSRKINAGTQSKLILGKRFYAVLGEVAKLREDLVTELTPILFLQDNKKLTSVKPL